MSTVYTKIADKSTGWAKFSGYILYDSDIEYDNKFLYDGDTPYTKTTDKDTPWGLFGGLIRLCTEGNRENIMSEGEVDYIVVSHGEDVEIWTDTSDVSSSWTKINDI